MEKVDVEVGLWLPSDVRRGLERRLVEEQMAVVEQAQSQMPPMQMQMQMSPLVNGGHQVSPEILQSPRQSHARMISDVGSFQSDDMTYRQVSPEAEARLDHASELGREKKEHEVALSTLLVNYIRVLAADRRNIALLILSALVAFLAIGSCWQQVPVYSNLGSFSHALSNDVLPSSAMPSLSVAPSPSPSIYIGGSASENDALVLSSVGSVPAEFVAASEREVILTSEIVEPASLTIDSPNSAQPTEATASPQLPETSQAQTTAAESFSLSAAPIESPIVPLESTESIRTTEPQTEGDMHDSLDDTVDSPAAPSGPSPSLTDYDISPHPSEMSADNEQPQLEREAKQPLDDTVDSPIMSSEPFSSPTDSIDPPVLLDISTGAAEPDTQGENEEQYEAHENTD
jgi:hypothetical protein